MRSRAGQGAAFVLKMVHSMLPTRLLFRIITKEVNSTPIPFISAS